MSKWWLWILVVILLIILLFGIIWTINSKKVAPTKSVNLYQKQADKICHMLDHALSLYKNNQIKEAHKLSESAYWDVYDNVLEIKYRSYATPEYIFSVENKFHQVSTLMEKPVTPERTKALTTQIKALCVEVNKEADYLIKHG